MRKVKLRSALIVAGGTLVIAGAPMAVLAPAFALATTSSTAQAAASARLDAAKLKVCTARQSVIDGILTRITNRGNRHLALNTDVATKVENFYTKSGKTLSNYNALVTMVNTDKTAAQSAVNQVKTDSTSFSCSGTDPLGTLQQFKDDVNGEVTALQAYKSSVQGLITGVKSVATTTSTSGGSQ